MSDQLFTSVYSTHRDYETYKGRWTKCRNVLAGEDVIKEATTEYLPMPTGMSTAEYNSYLNRAAFVELTARARDAMMGLVERKKPVLRAPEGVEELAEDITYTGTDLDSFAFQILGEVIDVGRCGVLVDYPVVPPGPELAYSDVEELGLRPYCIMYRAEDILDWREGRKGNRRVLTYLKLKEQFEEPMNDNPNATKLVTRIRVLRLGNTGQCIFELYDYDEDTGVIGLVPEFGAIFDGDGNENPEHYIYLNGEPIDFIPFSFFGPLDNSPTIQKPPLLAMANLNIHHYQASADRNHALHFCDLPTPILCGAFIGAEGEQPSAIRLGPTSAIHLQADGDAKFLEMTGNGIEPTRKLMDEYVVLMSILGNKILATDSRAAEAAETASIHRAGEQAILAAMANNVSNGLTGLLKIIASYIGENPDDVVYKLSTDYLPYSMDSQTLIALIGAVSAGKMSDEEFFEALVAGEMVRPDKTYEEHKQEIARMPRSGAITPDSGGTFGVPDKGIDNATNPSIEGSVALDGQVRTTS